MWERQRGWTLGTFLETSSPLGKSSVKTIGFTQSQREEEGRLQHLRERGMGNVSQLLTPGGPCCSPLSTSWTEVGKPI